MWEGNIYMNLPAFPMGCRVLFAQERAHCCGTLDDLYLQGQTYEECVQNVVDTTVFV